MAFDGERRKLKISSLAEDKGKPHSGTKQGMDNGKHFGKIG
jgi:hypothetical protein